jgi:dTDP-4-amino-4,6-dideoxy-D-galactose acyltransferase
MTVCEKLPWDSGFFGMSIGRVVGDTLDAAKAAAVAAWCKSEQVACVYFLARADDAATVRVAEANGYLLTDVRVELECRDFQKAFLLDNIREAAAADLPLLETIARTSFADSRFYADSHFPREKCAELYVRWVQESCRGFAHAVLVVEIDSAAAGFVTCKIEDDGGRIGLFGVAAAYRGRGLGHTLIQGALAWFAAKAAPRVSVVTQARNIASQRLYQRQGFLTRGVGLYYHKWMTMTY